MTAAIHDRRVLAEAFGADQGAARLVRQAALVAFGVAFLAVTAKIQFPVPPSPVMVSMGTFGVLAMGAAYGPRLGLVTILAYLVTGALGFDVFQRPMGDLSFLAYMGGSTGGYIVGYVLAVALMGALARMGWDRSFGRMALAMLAGNAVIYIPGLLWLGVLVAGGLHQPEVYGSVAEQTLAWGLTPFLIGDALKLALAALALPLVWKLTRR